MRPERRFALARLPDRERDNMNRRSFLTGLGALIAAPAVIRTPGLLMPVRALVKPATMAAPVEIPTQFGMATPGISTIYFDGSILVPRGRMMREARSLKLANPTDAPQAWKLVA